MITCRRQESHCRAPAFDDTIESVAVLAILITGVGMFVLVTVDHFKYNYGGTMTFTDDLDF